MLDEGLDSPAWISPPAFTADGALALPEFFHADNTFTVTAYPAAGGPAAWAEAEIDNHGLLRAPRGKAVFWAHAVAPSIATRAPVELRVANLVSAGSGTTIARDVDSYAWRSDFTAAVYATHGTTDPPGLYAVTDLRVGP
jgi:hypothetical protein